MNRLPPTPPSLPSSKERKLSEEEKLDAVLYGCIIGSATGLAAGSLTAATSIGSMALSFGFSCCLFTVLNEAFEKDNVANARYQKKLHTYNKELRDWIIASQPQSIPRI